MRHLSWTIMSRTLLINLMIHQKLFTFKIMKGLNVDTPVIISHLTISYIIIFVAFVKKLQVLPLPKKKNMSLLTLAKYFQKAREGKKREFQPSTVVDIIHHPLIRQKIFESVTGFCRHHCLKGKVAFYCFHLY